jgi:hypothetical protein
MPIDHMITKHASWHVKVLSCRGSNIVIAGKIADVEIPQGDIHAAPIDTNMQPRVLSNHVFSFTVF